MTTGVNVTQITSPTKRTASSNETLARGEGEINDQNVDSISKGWGICGDKKLSKFGSTIESPQIV